jgi:hypothetical protein
LEAVNHRLEISGAARAQLLRELAMFRGRRAVVCVSWIGASAELTRTASGGSRLVRLPAYGNVVVGAAPRGLDLSLIEDIQGIPIWMDCVHPGSLPVTLVLELEEGSVVVRSRSG